MKLSNTVNGSTFFSERIGVRGLRATNYVLLVLLYAFGSYHAEARMSQPGMGNVLLWQYGSYSVPEITAVKWGHVIGDENPGDYVDLSSWVLLGSGDFDADGYGDFLWLNKWSGAVTVWLMRGSLIKSIPTDPLGEVPRLADGSPARAFIADMDQDGKSDIIWEGDQLPEKIVPKNPDDPLKPPLDDPLHSPPPRYRYSSWRIDLTSSMPVIESSGSTIGRIQAIGQFDGTGGLDLLTTYVNVATGLTYTRIALADGTSHQGPQVISAWQVRGAGDFDGNGTTDVLWHREDTGEVAIWEMAGGNYARSHHLGDVPTSISTVDGIGDLDSNGVSDIIWRRNSDNWLTIWSLGQNFAVLHRGEPGFKLAFPLAGTMATDPRFGSVVLTVWHYVSSGTRECPLFNLTLADSAGVSKTYGPFGGPTGYSPKQDASGNWLCDHFIHYTGISDTYTITTTLGLRKMITIPPDDSASFELCADGTGCKAPEADIYFFGGSQGALTPVPSVVSAYGVTNLVWRLCNDGDAPSKPVKMELEICWARDYWNGGHAEECWSSSDDKATSVRPACSADPNDLSCFPNQYNIPQTDTRVIPPGQCLLQTMINPLKLIAGYWQVKVDEETNYNGLPAVIRWMCSCVLGAPCERLYAPPVGPLIPPGPSCY